MPPRFSITRLQTYLAFVLLNGLLLLWVVPQLPPEPIYRTTAGDPKAPFIELESGKPVAFSFAAQGDDIRAVLLQYLFTDGSRDSYLNATVENVTREVTLAEERLTFGDMREIAFTPNNTVGDEIRITVEVGQSIKQENPEIVQALKRAFYSPKKTITMTIDGESVSGSEMRPIFTVKYARPATHLLWLWPLMLIVAAGMYLSKWNDLKHRLPLYLSLGLLLTVTSLVMFAGRIYQQWDFVDPDSYGDAAQRLGAWFGGELEQREKSAEWLRGYAHTFAPLVPLLLAIGYLLGLPHLLVYTFLVSCASFGVLLLTDWIAKTQLKFSTRTALATVILLATNLVFLKSFARPSTDMIGLVLIVAGLGAVHLRYKIRYTWRQNLAFAVLLALICFSRPPGMGYAFLIGVAALGADASRRRGLLAPGLLRHGLQIVVPFLAIMGAFWFKFDWFHNFEINLEKAKQFQDRANFATFWPVAVTLLLPLLVLLPFSFRRSRFPLHLHAGFILASLIMLTWVQAPWILRLLLPIIPSITLVMAGALAHRRRAWIPGCFVLVYALIHLGLLYYEYQLIHLPGPGIARFIYY